MEGSGDFKRENFVRGSGSLKAGLESLEPVPFLIRSLLPDFGHNVTASSYFWAHASAVMMTSAALKL